MLIRRTFKRLDNAKLELCHGVGDSRKKYGLRLLIVIYQNGICQSLNPCCNGKFRLSQMRKSELVLGFPWRRNFSEKILCKSDEQSQARLSYAMTQPKFSKEIWSQT